MKTRMLLFTLSVLFVLAGLAPRVQAQAGTETLTLIDGACTQAAPCALQLYRAALLPGTSSCPIPGSSLYTALTTTLQSTSVGTVNSAWFYADSTVGFGTTYCYYATVTFIAGGSACRPSAFFTMTTPALVPALAPSISGSYGPTATPASTPAAARVNVTPSPAAAPSISGSYKPTAAPATTKK
jgi:hypothetical protein